MDVKVKNNLPVVVVLRVKACASVKESRTGQALVLGNRLATIGDWEAWVNCEACAREDDGEESAGVHSCRTVGSGALVEVERQLPEDAKKNEQEWHRECMRDI
jgi:hypothetical protein